MCLETLYNIVEKKSKQEKKEGYTTYLLDSGLDKILKKVGEETAEVIVAAKNEDPQALAEEIADLLYHMTVLMVAKDLPLEAVGDVLRARQK